LSKLSADQLISILITDVNMPGMSGYELAEIASRNRRGLHVIVLSGRETEGHGFPILRKPFAQEDLQRTMRHTTGLC
jgi:CheY-like chemotaxis protein